MIIETLTDPLPKAGILERGVAAAVRVVVLHGRGVVAHLGLHLVGERRLLLVILFKFLKSPSIGKRWKPKCCLPFQKLTLKKI